MPMSEQKRTIDSQADYNKRKAAQKSGKSRVYSAMFMSEKLFFTVLLCLRIAAVKTDKRARARRCEINALSPTSERKSSPMMPLSLFLEIRYRRLGSSE